jgi:hypothetical protein
MPSAALYEALARFEDLKTGLDGRYLDLIEKIDHLDERVVYQRGHIELFNAPANCRPANGLEALVERIEFNVQEMEDDLARRAPSTPVVMAVTRSEPPAPIPVLTDFDPRN